LHCPEPVQTGAGEFRNRFGHADLNPIALRQLYDFDQGIAPLESNSGVGQLRILDAQLGVFRQAEWNAGGQEQLDTAAASGECLPIFHLLETRRFEKHPLGVDEDGSLEVRDQAGSGANHLLRGQVGDERGTGANKE
jgi:hypothetical protein